MGRLAALGPSALIRRVTETGNPILITQNGRPTAVLQDVATYQRQRDLLLLLKAIVQGDRDYEAGRVLPDEEARRRFRDRLAGLQEAG